MQRDPRAFLWDTSEAAKAIVGFTSNLDMHGYLSDTMVQAAVERKFEVIGEALNQLSKCNPELAARVPDYKQIVAFRNLLIHGYASVDPETVWNAVQSSLPVLLQTVSLLLDEAAANS
jgi:uncharacterized protein with HEPN domain